MSTGSQLATDLAPDQGLSASATPFRRLFVAEARNALQPRHVAIAGLLVGMGVLLALWLPLFPETMYRFFTRVFRLDGWSDVVLANSFTGLLFFLYWLGVVDVLRVYVQPYEEQYLDLLLSKPITRRDYLLARIVPLLVVLLIIGVVAAGAQAIAMIAVGLPLDIATYASAVAILLAFTLCLVALANLLLVGVRDSFTALVVAFVPFMVVMMPGVAFIYRPDVYDAAPLLPHLLVLPANLLWHDDVVTRGGPVIVLALLVATLALVALAGARLARRDAH
jgi:ABC-type Na+ efflux pump permease subunit